MRFEYIGITAEDRRYLGKVLADSIRARIRRGIDVNDQPAPPLSKSYARYKQRRGLPPIRDWSLRSGKTLRALQPHASGNGDIVIGFNTPAAARIAATNNARWRMFGVSPNDLRVLRDAVANLQIVRVVP